jgi:hypothetical protein
MSEHGQISEDKFAHIVRHAPLVSLDLIVREPEGRVLVGLNHRPRILLDSQHSSYKWMDELALIDAADVHENTKAYFR